MSLQANNYRCLAVTPEVENSLCQEEEVDDGMNCLFAGASSPRPWQAMLLDCRTCIHCRSAAVVKELYVISFGDVIK